MDHKYPTVAKIPVLDTGKFEQWQFRMQQYLQHEHYALWEVIEFRDSYEVPANDPSTTTTNTTSGKMGMKSGRTVTLTTEDMKKKKNDATKKMKKNILKQQYGNFRAEGSETLEQTFTKLQVIVGQLQFMDVEVEQDDLNQKFLTSLAPEWLMHTIVWRNRSDLDTMSQDDLYNHLKELETLKKEKEVVDGKLAGLLTALKDLDNLIESQRAPKSQERGRRDNYKQGSKVEEQVLKSLMAIDEVGWDWSYMANDKENHARAAPVLLTESFSALPFGFA
nr:hypothetical protein [Tanacetum cinerariifolium]